MKYLLISIQGRDICEPCFFKTHEEAHNKMCEQLAEATCMSTNQVKELYLEGRESESGFVVLENQAWAEYHGRNFDWAIFEYKDEVSWDV